jgi:hypothetical protein
MRTSKECVVLSGNWQIDSIFKERECSVEPDPHDDDATAISDLRRRDGGDTRGLTSGRRTSLSGAAED